MPSFFSRAGRLFIICILQAITLPALLHAETENPAAPADGEADEWLFLEDEEGLTITENAGTASGTAIINVIEREEIEKHNAADLAALLQEMLHIGFTRYGGYGNAASINLRGFDSKRVALLVDGIPVNSALDGKINIELIDLNSVERIEITYGGSDTKHNVSGALGGVINVITVKTQEHGLTLKASAANTSAAPGEYLDRGGKLQSPHWEDLFDAQKYSLGAAYGGNAFSFSANAFANQAGNHFLFTDYTGKTRRKDNNEVWDTGASLSFVRDLPSFAKLTASSNLYYGNKNFPSSGFSSLIENQNDFSMRQSFTLDMLRAFRDDLAADVSATYNFSGRLNSSPLNGESRHDQHGAIAASRWNWYPGSRAVIRGGLDYSFVYLDSTAAGNHERHGGGVSLAAEYRPSPAFMLAPSILAALTSGGSQHITAVPKLGLLLDAGDSLTIKNNYFRSFKLPDFEELYWIGGGAYGNSDLRPEDGWGTDLGAEWRFKDFFQFDGAFFAQRTTGSIHWYSNEAGIWRPENVGEAVFFGFDGKLRFEIPVSLGPIKKLIPSISYQYLLSYLLCYGYDYSSNKRIPYMPLHTAGASLDIPWSTGSLFISAHYEGRRYSDTANLTELEPHFLLNAALNLKITENLSIFAVLGNILNESYESFYNYPMPGFTATVGIKTRFEVK